MKPIIIVDYHFGGHHFSYLRLINKVLLENGYSVITLSPYSVELMEWVEKNCNKSRGPLWTIDFSEPSVLTNTNVKGILGPVAQYNKWLKVAQAVSSVIKNIGISPELVFFNWIDDLFGKFVFTGLVDKIFPYYWSGLYFRPTGFEFGQEEEDKTKKNMEHFSVVNSKKCLGLGILNEDISESIYERTDGKSFVFPDIADTLISKKKYPVEKEIIVKAKGRKIIGLLGSLNIRKGLNTLLQAAMTPEGENFFFVFAGSLPEGIFCNGFSDSTPDDFAYLRSTYEKQPENCFFFLKHIPDEREFNAIVNTCDILFAAYKDFPYSSNILTKAAYFHKPVIVSSGFCMEKRVLTHNIGATISQGNVQDCLDKIYYLSNNFNPNDENLIKGFEHYKKNHSTDKIITIFESLLKLKQN
jgi:hypothetical protein